MRHTCTFDKEETTKLKQALNKMHGVMRQPFVANIIIIYGPQGSGKTLVARELAKRLPHPNRVIDEWVACDRHQTLVPGDVACTIEAPPYKHSPTGARILSVDDARALVSALKA